MRLGRDTRHTRQRRGDVAYSFDPPLREPGIKRFVWATVSASILPSFDFTLAVFTLLAAAPVMLAADYERLAGAHPLAAEHCLVARPARQRSLSSRCPLLQVKRQKVHLAEVVGAQVLHVLEGAH